VQAVFAIIGGLFAAPFMLSRGNLALMPLRFLRMIDRRFLVKDYNIFMRTERHSVGVQKAGGRGLLPNERIAVQLWPGQNQLRRKTTGAEKDHGRGGLYQWKKRLPHRFKGNYRIPAVPGSAAIGRIAKHQINGALRERGKNGKTIVQIKSRFVHAVTT